MRVSKSVKKSVALATAVAMAITSLSVFSFNKANAATGKIANTDLVYAATVTVGKDAESNIIATSSNSNFSDIATKDKATDEITGYKDIAEAGWASGTPEGWSVFISHEDTMNIMNNYEKPQLRVTSGSAVDMLLQEQCTWSTANVDATTGVLDLTQWQELYQGLNDVKGEDDWQGLVVVIPTDREVSFEIVDAAKPELSFGMQDGAWVEHNTKLSVQGNGEYSINIDDISGETLKNVGFFKATDESLRIKMGKIVVNGTYNMTLATPNDLNYDALNPSDGTINGLPNIWNPEGMAEIVAEGEDAYLIGDGGSNISLIVNDKNTAITSLTYYFILSGLSYDKSVVSTATPTPSEEATATPTASVKPSESVNTPIPTATVKTPIVSANPQISATSSANAVKTVSAPAQVKKVAAKNNKKKTAIVSWSKVKGADGYIVYRATKKSGKYKQVKVLTSAKKTKYSDKKVKKGKTYFYKVKAYKKNGTKKVMSKKYSAIIKVKITK